MAPPSASELLRESTVGQKVKADDTTTLGTDVDFSHVSKRRFLLTCALGLFAALFVTALPVTAAAKEQRPVMKIAIYQDGRIVADGRTTNLPALREALTSLSKAGGSVWYYREGGENEPDPNALLVLQAILDARLPVSLSSKPDFSTVVLPNGATKPR